MKDLSGVNSFFEDQPSYLDFHSLLERDLSYAADSDRREFGDFQAWKLFLHSLSSPKVLTGQMALL